MVESPINLVEFQILPLESPIRVSTGRKSILGDLGISLGFRNLINAVAEA